MLCPCTQVPQEGYVSDNPSYQDVQLKFQWMTLAYVQVLQYCAEEPNPPAPGQSHPLAMSVRELMQHLRKFTTFTEQDVFKGLESALSGAMVEDTQLSLMETPPADSMTSSVMIDVKDTSSAPQKLNQ